MQPTPEQEKGQASWEPEQLLADRYRVKECVRESGTLQLYRVQDVFKNCLHLVLRPSPRILARAGGREWAEQYCLSVLSVPIHPNVLACERMDNEGELSFLVMENAEGRGWDSAIRDGSLVDLADMLDVAIQVAEGLAWLHGQGRIHYNFKPGNVLIGSSGTVKVWKYGEASGRTRAYASPEQMAGESRLTPATDVWSWAVSVLHMFLGVAAWPSGAEAGSALGRYMQSGPAKPGIAIMPGALGQLLAACLKEDPDDRLVTMDEIVEALQGIYEHSVGEGYSVPALAADDVPQPAVQPEEADLADLLLADEADAGAPSAEDPQPVEPEPPPAAGPDGRPPSQAAEKRFGRGRPEGARGSRRRYRRS